MLYQLEISLHSQSYRMSAIAYIALALQLQWGKEKVLQLDTTLRSDVPDGTS